MVVSVEKALPSGDFYFSVKPPFKSVQNNAWLTLYDTGGRGGEPTHNFLYLQLNLLNQKSGGKSEGPLNKTFLGQSNNFAHTPPIFKQNFVGSIK